MIWTALIAVGISVGRAYQLNRSLNQQRSQLFTLSSRLPMHDDAELVSAPMPTIADDFHSWHVYVPKEQDYELRLGMGDVSERGIPPVVGSVAIPAGEHRVTLYSGDAVSEGFRFAVYLDGVVVIDKSMEKGAMPKGWTSANGLSWPTFAKLSPPPLQLEGKSYEPTADFGDRNYFNGNSDTQVTRPGFRLWIDTPDRTYPPASPFIGFLNEQYRGIGLRDGVRFTTSTQTYQWKFTRPSLAISDLLIGIEAEFVASDGRIISNQTKGFKYWQLRNAATGTDALRWTEEPAQTSYSAFLHPVFEPADTLQPVVELKWDLSHPDAVGIRLADTPANDSIERWRLRTLDGSQHLWRELQIGEGPWITPADALATRTPNNESSEELSKQTATLDLGDSAAMDFQLRWQTNERLPLQIVQRNDNRYYGLKLYRGLPVLFGLQIPATAKAKLAVDVTDQFEDVPVTASGTTIPGGAVFDSIEFDLDGTTHHWIWISARSQK